MNRRVGVLAVSLLAASVAVPSYAASHATSTVTHGQKRVCAVPSGRSAACDAHVVTNAKTGKPLATSSPTTGYSPQQLQNVYGTGGGTQLVAVVDAYANPNAAADLKAYRDYYGLGTASLTQVDQNGNAISSVGADVGWGQEEMLDLEMVSAMCPSCPILYVGGKSASFSDLAAAVARAKTLKAAVISNSYGNTEFSQETQAAYSGPYNATNVTVTVSSGDSGYGAQFPAAASNVVAVGGTSLKLTSSGARSSESVWSGAGSGCSAYVTRPSWQASTATGCSHRMVTDISAVADPNTGVTVYDSYGSSGGNNWFIFGGTSVAAPLIGGLYGAYNLGGSNTAAANAWSSTGRAALFDVASGSNGRCVRGHTGKTLWCTGVSGYDGPSGNGAPTGNSAAF